MTQKVLEEVSGGITANDVVKARNAVLDIQAEISERRGIVGTCGRSRNFIPGLSDRLPTVCEELHGLLLERIGAEWRAVVLSLEFAAQSPADLMEHPGYGAMTDDEMFPFPLNLSDISRDLFEQCQAVKNKVRSLLDRFDGAIFSIDADLVVFRNAVEEIERKQKSLEELKEQRRHSAARGEDTRALAQAIGAALVEIGQLKEQVSKAEDDSAGLDLRRAAFLDAKSCAEKALWILGMQLSTMELCFLAGEYNHHAQRACELLDRFRRESIASPVNTVRRKTGVPRLPWMCKVYIPKVLLHHANKDGTSTEKWNDLYFSIIEEGGI
jgi:hypothetical protein